MTAASGPATRSLHLRQPGEGAPLRREGPPQLVFVEAPALRQSGRKGERETTEGSKISTGRFSSAHGQSQYSKANPALSLPGIADFPRTNIKAALTGLTSLLCMKRG